MTGMKQPFGSVVLDAAARLMVPYILLFALYVLAHGHHSPGGGFQAGTMLAAAVILVRLVRGRAPRWGVTRKTAVLLAAAGVLLYAGIGLACVLFKGNYLDYSALPLPFPKAEIRSLGILGIETGVALGVMGTMILIYDCLTDRKMDEA